jgi:hypothetical protein
LRGKNESMRESETEYKRVGQEKTKKTKRVSKRERERERERWKTKDRGKNKEEREREAVCVGEREREREEESKVLKNNIEDERSSKEEPNNFCHRQAERMEP